MRTQFCRCGRILLTFFRGKTSSLRQLEPAAVTWSPLPAVKTLLMLANTEKLLQLLARSKIGCAAGAECQRILTNC